jgi:hypothetical protein
MANEIPEEEFVQSYSKAREIEHNFTKKVRPDIRAKFGNSALKFAKAFLDPKNNEQFYELGLKRRPEVHASPEQIAQETLVKNAMAAAKAKAIAEYKAANPT